LPQETPRGILGALIDLLSWLRIYKQRAFWIQIAAAIVGILLWIIILPEESIGGALTAFPTLVFLSFIMTNIVWAASKRPYSCIVGSSIGYGIYNLAVIAILRHDLSALDGVIYVVLGVIYGFVFSWFAFFIFNVLGLIKFERKKQTKDSPSSNVPTK
jgi:drug/metabolite transporter (DMT)-like permease